MYSRDNFFLDNFSKKCPKKNSKKNIFIICPKIIILEYSRTF